LPDELSLYTKEALIDMIRVALGGRVAEQIFFNKVTTGAGDDIKKVTRIAHGLVQIYGMSETFGLMSYQGDDGAMVKPFSESTAQRIDEEIKKLVDQCYEDVRVLLEEKRELVEK
jgi:AFG3 family protein